VPSNEAARGRRAVRAGEIDPDDAPELLVCCRDCALREFGA
jgi:hypothetical protein